MVVLLIYQRLISKRNDLKNHLKNLANIFQLFWFCGNMWKTLNEGNLFITHFPCVLFLALAGKELYKLNITFTCSHLELTNLSKLSIEVKNKIAFTKKFESQL
jgi:hypothetical protein